MLVLERNVNKVRRTKKVILGQEKDMRAGDTPQRGGTLGQHAIDPGF